MRYLLPLFAVLLVGCAAQSDVTLKAKGDGLMTISYLIGDEYSETTALNEFEQSYSGEPPTGFTVVLQNEGGVMCELVINGSIVASEIDAGIGPVVQCQQ